MRKHIITFLDSDPEFGGETDLVFFGTLNEAWDRADQEVKESANLGLNVTYKIKTYAEN